MDQIFSKWQPVALSLLRFMAGLLFLQYGFAKLLKWPPVPMFEKVELFSLYGAAGSIELIGGILLVLGLFTRVVAFIASGEMAFAYFMSHAPRGFFPILNHGDLAILFCFVFLYLACAGGGPISLDAVRKK
ncbi:DoxX family protein [Bradyrhizobium sp. BRP22]|uniref:DoxX family protein n=1 Tax=Bradyrhizobium sp. BRP22 TaxID=2793821 RepID=UPI001CD6E506|nr:DoxX family protein [Bradyrhizobium sp. BRP22]MCA1454735.1 DoxX family protein [Bradyrhizobium sp. BRP22]